MNKAFFILFYPLVSLFCENTLVKDIKYFYSIDTYGILLKAMIPATFMANSPIDNEIYHFYEENIRCTATDDFSKVVKVFGSKRPLLAGLLTIYGVGSLTSNTKMGNLLLQFSENSLRSIIVGLPTLILGQNLLGADRPYQNTDSYYHPFRNDHGISGHAYMGAIPFITAANLSTNIWLKALFFFGSTLTGLSRINDAAHFASQVLLGWTLAFASCNAILKTNRSITINGDKVTISYLF